MTAAQRFTVFVAAIAFVTMTACESTSEVHAKQERIALQLDLGSHFQRISIVRKGHVCNGFSPRCDSPLVSVHYTFDVSSAVACQLAQQAVEKWSDRYTVSSGFVECQIEGKARGRKFQVFLGGDDPNSAPELYVTVF
jgi:hypothetical protein